MQISVSKQENTHTRAGLHVPFFVRIESKKTTFGNTAAGTRPSPGAKYECLNCETHTHTHTHTLGQQGRLLSIVFCWFVVQPGSNPLTTKKKKQLFFARTLIRQQFESSSCRFFFITHPPPPPQKNNKRLPYSMKKKKQLQSPCS